MLYSIFSFILVFDEAVSEEKSGDDLQIPDDGYSDHDWICCHLFSGGCHANLTIRKNREITPIISTYIEYLTYKYIIMKKYTLTHFLTYLFQGVSLQYSCSAYDDDEIPVLTTPCHSIYFLSWKPSDIYWHIYVHASFMLNITIEEGYVPYSLHCQLHFISVYDGAGWSRELDYFCGKIMYESIYTEYNRASVSIISRATMTLYPVFLSARYTSHIRRSAYKYIYPCSERDIRGIPAVVWFFKNWLYYVWYLSNKAYYASSYFFYELAIAHWKVYIERLVCEPKHAITHIYPGLLPFRWSKWMVKPHHTASCNITEFNNHSVKTDFHMHATVQLELIPTVRTEFKLFFQTILNDLALMVQKTYSEYRQNGSNFLSIDFISKIESLTIQRFTYSGQHSTVFETVINGPYTLWSTYDKGIYLPYVIQ